MKTIRIIVIVLLISSVNLFAQKKDLKDLYTDFTTAINTALLTQQGSMEVSGFLSYNYLKTDFKNNDENIQTIIQLEPQFSYFVMDNISLGLALSHSNNKTEFESNLGTVEFKQTLIGPIAKMYFGDETHRPFIFTDYLIMLGDLEGGELDLGAGVFYHVTGNFGLNLFGKYGIIWPGKNNIDNQQRIFFGIGITNFIL